MQRIANGAKNFITGLASSRLFQVGIAVYLAYWALALFAPTRGLNETANIFAMAVSGAVFVSWFSGFVQAVSTRQRTGSWTLVMGVAVGALAVFQQQGWAFLRSWTKADWMFVHPFTGSTNIILVLAGLLILLSPDNLTGEVPQKNWWWIAVALSVASAIAGAVVTAIFLGRY
jgi:hypothetical protein